ncbi:MAG: hypothetical protein ACRC3H_19785 [Lachnospiraceae bacterium]
MLNSAQKKNSNFRETVVFENYDRERLIINSVASKLTSKKRIKEQDYQLHSR